MSEEPPFAPEEIPPESTDSFGVYHDLNAVDVGHRRLIADSRVNANLDTKKLSGGITVPREKVLQDAAHDYQVIVSAANAETSESGEKVYGPITPERVAHKLLGVARTYTHAVRNGLLTAYATPAVSQPAQRRSNGGVESPWDTQRIAIPVDQIGTQALLAEHETVRIAALSEILDPYRYRQDDDTPTAERAAQAAEQDEAAVLLASLEGSWEKDLLTAAAVRHYLHPHINRPDLADKVIQLMSVPALQYALAEAKQSAAQATPEKVISRVSQHSEQVLDTLIAGCSDETKAALKQQAIMAAESDKFRVTINLRLETLEKMLFDTYRLLPATEAGRSGGNPSEIGDGREAAEAALGIHDAEQAIVERPIYGALAVTNQERNKGARNAEGYGECVITIKPEVAQKRAVYTFGDTMNLMFFTALKPEKRNSQLMTLQQAEVAKLYYDATYANKRDQVNGNLGYWYVESQILGGVSTEDIESVTIPYSVGLRHRGVVGLIRERYSSLPIRLSATSKENQEFDNDLRRYLEDQRIEVIEI